MTQSTPKSGRLTKPAWVGNTSFAAGVDEQLVIDRAQREYEYQQQPEQVAARLAKFSDFQSRLASHAEPAASDGLARSERQPTKEEILEISDKFVRAVTEDYWKDAIVQWPERLRHTKDCNVHEPILRPCSCGLETRLKDEILAALRSRPAEREDAFADKYHELLLAVSMKHPGESRHETALRYIRNAERPQQGTDAAMSQQEGKEKAHE